MDGRGEKGFTLIELVLIIVVVGILAVVVGMGLNSLDTVRLNNAVGKVVADLRYAQQLATTTQGRHGLTIDSAQVYSVHRDTGGTDTDVKDPTNLGQDFAVDFDTYQQEQLKGVRFNSTTPFCTGPPGCTTCGSVIEFTSLGVPTDTAGTALCSVSLVLTQVGAPNQTISITPNTGRIGN
ncbi:MAG: Tfp pilus assembly protein FimT/FimU [Nitrospiria bacterium]